MVRSSDRLLRLRVILEDLPDLKRLGIVGGLQDRSRQVYPANERAPGVLVCDLEARVRRDADRSEPNFLGPWVHGPRGGRFLYIAWIREEEQADGFRPYRRLKVSLREIGWEQVEAAQQAGCALVVRLSGRDRHGDVACGTVSPRGGGWTVERVEDFQPFTSSEQAGG
ncbi:MAG: hypothetical protein KatS3mg115_2292 [Candidatus Poribacteria bacterium]|nr:MAG: hypothetical protein KatS3mg115_2292 [Candidatus Poribacteria bacterium]